MKKTWLKNHKHRFYKAWTDKIIHFGTITTSRVESGHRVLKSNLKFSTGDLLYVVDCIEAMLSKQYREFNTKLARAKIRVAYNLPHGIMTELIGKVSPHALEKIRKQWKTIKRFQADPEEYPMKACTSGFSTTMGLPSSHKIKTCMESKEKRLKLENIHAHWLFKKPTVPQSPPESPPANTTSRPFYTTPPPYDEDPDDFETLPEIQDLLHGGNSRIERPISGSPSEGSELDDLTLQDMI